MQEDYIPYGPEWEKEMSKFPKAELIKKLGKAFQKIKDSGIAGSNYSQSNEAKGCPCLVLDDPCHPHCTCKNGLYSGGCLYCAKYGNLEQRKEAAEKIKHALANASKVEEDQEGLWKEAMKAFFGELTETLTKNLDGGEALNQLQSKFTIKRK